MCGIAGGIWSSDSKALTPQILKRMTDALVHRGPDDEGQYFQTQRNNHSNNNFASEPVGVGLGFRRLSIIDLVGGHQPMSNEDGTIWIVFNGEIYNYLDLRRRLEGNGHRFSTDTDTETIVHLYEDLGADCFAQLNGMFAIAIWDSRHNRLVLARDRVGKKPLFYAHTSEQTVFASELKSLIEVPGLNREINPTAIDHYLTYQYIPHPFCIYKGVSKVKPGHVLTFENGTKSERRFWNVNWSHIEPVSPADRIDAIRETLIDSVRIRLRSDVPLGAFLSGGVDSSLIVAIAQQQLQQPINTFSIGFAESSFDETAYAQQVADHVGSSHQRFEVTPDAVSILDDLIYHYDEPFADSSAIPTWYLCQQTRQQVTVALSGDGGDELFAGYERYHALELSQRYQRWLPTHTLLKSYLFQRLSQSTKQRSFFRRLRRFCEAADQPPALRYMNWLQIFGEQQRSELYQQNFLEQLNSQDPFDFIRKPWDQTGQRGLIDKASLTDLQTYLPCDLMTKVDIASMAHSLEARQPFLDFRLMELMIATPGESKMVGGKGKVLLQQAFGDMLPDAIWKRRKMGFGVPIGEWFRKQLKTKLEQTLLHPEARVYQFLNPASVEQLIQSHLSGKVNQAYRLWNLFVLELWLKRWT